MTLTTSSDWAFYLLTCGLMGMTGQFIRAIGGVKKARDAASANNASLSDVFEWPAFLTSLGTGFAAGVIAGLTLQSDDTSPPWLGMLAAGYAGSDFVEAFMTKKLQHVPNAAGAANQPQQNTAAIGAR
ncbi:hypothetical protein SSBR45G_40850 [Bradyrhizobium sp. SSBR45G]|uniref:hypothetical protein n=1 Tax=unclassified Bradyrhizobium TaxID=2631580 RepID=UPI0023429163|nr:MULTISPECIES: hypothetical protein [unclassified Bradyrhizobium]GLH79176.1 hypothetical protein SSBR45G_40850 [Bradyrhizobium sp. SSBR45G]GLH84611.1 hypothetical protein SSBR45R_20710 [Bradyrhizobium sp. SSBR45R]